MNMSQTALIRMKHSNHLCWYYNKISSTFSLIYEKKYKHHIQSNSESRIVTNRIKFSVIDVFNIITFHASLVQFITSHIGTYCNCINDRRKYKRRMLIFIKWRCKSYALHDYIEKFKSYTGLMGSTCSNFRLLLSPDTRVARRTSDRNNVKWTDRSFICMLLALFRNAIWCFW